MSYYRKNIKDYSLFLTALLGLTYVGYHAIAGKHGLNSGNQIINSSIPELDSKINLIQHEITDLKAKVVALKQATTIKNANADIIDFELRYFNNSAESQEVIIMREKPLPNDHFSTVR